MAGHLSLCGEINLVRVRLARSTTLSTIARARIYFQTHTIISKHSLVTLSGNLETQHHLPFDLLPQAQVLPEGLVFSCDEREQVQAPAARWLQLQRAPSTLFSVADFSQLQARAGCLPQEQVASFAQTQPPERPQQVTGTVEVGADIFVCVVV